MATPEDPPIRADGGEPLTNWTPVEDGREAIGHRLTGCVFLGLGGRRGAGGHWTLGKVLPLAAWSCEEAR